ncbi:DUF2235 domain-containing protein [Pseudonocardia sp. C8]|uniref:DUF2235 domain-containing protein n=1 Tax=Pseudonocardia sp. C8 TaxID=2762759 RepID=UPI001642A36E|nr:DUF2235 domain-containing protein [Pseudonocardia sp. C8]MBC3191020.1 DUF2235 domain-containing protein [Pseudonocardia sp. C8]
MQLAVFMDGTWNDPADDTNVDQLAGRMPEVERGPGGRGQRTHYIKGVGNGPWDRLRGGILGRGVDDNIREGYAFIVDNHRPGDQIFLVGYSRGAFTARSLAGMITKCGLIPPDVLGADAVFERYRDRARPGLREMQHDEDDPGRRTDQDRTVLAHARLERIRFIGVFDTVGSLGIPGDIGKVFARRYQFHNTALSGYVDIARHAVAIDENRPEFEPTLWTAVPIPIPGHHTSIEQRWFVGAHSDVGGGGERARERAPLSALAREWIADEARTAGLHVEAPRAPLTGDEWRSPYRGSFATWLRALTWLAPWRRPYLRPVHTSEGEKLAPSVLQRWNGDPAYRPRNPNLAPWVKRLSTGGGARPPGGHV